MHRWKLSALAAAALVSVSLTATDAWALALGRISMQSALGEPLRAEVELPQITAAEADSLQANIATPAVFRAQGMEYSSTASQLKVQLHRRPDGSAVLRLSSAQPINEPFVDLVLNASWGAGQVVRSYTLLLDPPALRRPAPGVTAAPQAAMPAAPASAAPAAAAAAAPTATRSPAAAAPTPAAQPSPAPSARNSATQTVRLGDTAGRLASAHRPAGVSLDQMLVAMLRANPHAFISGNVNRIKAGAVVQIPDQATAQATPVSEARQIVAAQSHDFNQYRRQLAGAAPMATVETAKRSASGNVEAQVEDKKPSTAAPDKLTLSKGALEASKNADERLAQDKQAQSQSERLAELSRNLTELQQVSGTAATTAAGTPAAPSAASTTPSTGIALGTSAAAAPADAQPAAAETTAPAEAPAAPAAEPAAAVASATQAPPAAAPAPAPAQESGVMDFLGEDPIRPLAGAGLLALLLGYAGYRVSQRRRQQRDSLLGDSQLQTDSFFGAGGGQRVDTAHSQFGSGTSMAYSPSQLDTGGEVDAVAEADVYLAYGRDLQAEEILKEALRSQPDRIAVHQKLADIYAKRQDRKAFEAVAQAVLALTQGQGADWRHLAEQGRVLDPGNSLYQSDALATPGADSVFPNTQPVADDAALAPVAMAAAAGALAATALQDPRTEPSLPPGLDLDLDLDLPGGLADQAVSATAAQNLPAHSPNDIDFEAIEPTWKLPASTDAPAEAESVEPEALAADFPALSPELSELADDTGATEALQGLPAAPDAAAQPPAADAPWSGQAMEFSLDSDAAPAPAEPVVPAPAAPAFDSLEFDLGNLSLDLGDTPPASLSQSSLAAAEDPLATKLALAQEFAAIGDSEGARTLIEEVVEEAHGELKARAQRLLTEID